MRAAYKYLRHPYDLVAHARWLPPSLWRRSWPFILVVHQVWPGLSKCMNNTECHEDSPSHPRTLAMQQVCRTLRLVFQASTLGASTSAATVLPVSGCFARPLQPSAAHWTQLVSGSCSTSSSFSSAAPAAKSAARPAAKSAAQSPRWVPSSFTSNTPLIVSYPFPIAYLKDREMLIYDLGRRPLGVDMLAGSTFNVPVRIDILHRVVRYLRAKWQQGTHKAKARHEVSGGTRKPRPQKKTGRSRQGSIRSPLWKGGAATFGPRPRSHAHKLPKNVQLLGMKCALSAKCNEGRMVVVESLASVRGATVGAKAAINMLTALIQGTGGKSALMVDSGERSDDGGRLLRTAAGMMSDVHVMPFQELTVYHVLKYNTLIISKPALQQLAEKLCNPPHRNRLPLRKAWWKREVQEFKKAALELEAVHHLTG